MGTGLASVDDFNARAGVILGSRLLLYSEAGAGFRPGGYTWTAGGGAEFAIGPNFSVFAEVKAAGTFGSGYDGRMIQAGFNFYEAGCGPLGQRPRPCWLLPALLPGAR